GRAVGQTSGFAERSKGAAKAICKATIASPEERCLHGSLVTICSIRCNEGTRSRHRVAKRSHPRVRRTDRATGTTCRVAVSVRSAQAHLGIDNERSQFLRGGPPEQAALPVRPLDFASIRRAEYPGPGAEAHRVPPPRHSHKASSQRKQKRQSPRV